MGTGPGRLRGGAVAGVLVGLTLLIAGCAAPASRDTGGEAGAGSAPEPTALPQAGADPPEDGPSALDDMRQVATGR